jgi:cobalt-zinc-cadmium efflux system outer membrane protein
MPGGGGLRWVRLAECTAALLAGCAGREVAVPAGYLPPPSTLSDLCTSVVVAADAQRAAPTAPAPAQPVPPPEPGKPPGKPKQAFDLPPGLPGADAPLLRLVQPDPTAPAAEQAKFIRDAYPPLPRVPGLTDGRPAGPPLGLDDLQRMAAENSPALRRTKADAEASLAAVLQAGLHPNPTVGYELDQWQPGRDMTKHNNGQQGGFVNQLLKYPGKLSLARAVAGFDYLNAVVAVRRAEVDVATAIRTNYFAALVAAETVRVNLLLIQVADEVYRLQLALVRAGEAAGAEPLQLYAQAALARTALAQAEASYRALWRQLAAAVGRPDLPPAPLAARTDAPAPAVDADAARARMLAGHTDLLTARNAVLQAEVSLRLQRITPRPDLQTNAVVQYDNAVKNPQFNLQLGVPLPVFDRNQGNIWRAEATVGRAAENVRATETDLAGRLAEALGRLEANRAVVVSYREHVLPNLARSYRALVVRYHNDPARAGFSDVLVAQQGYAQALQAYLAAVAAQWQAVVDVAALTQQDELYDPCPPAGGAPPAAGLPGPPTGGKANAER